MTETFEPGDRLLDRYVVEGVLGQGGMATVYRVRHTALGSVHALKVLDLPTANLRARFLQEGRIQASLQHPNVVTVTDALDLGGRPALVMEFVEGRSLADLLAERRPALDEALGWFREILSAVGYAHARGLVHRDLKPENILMSPRNGGFVPKVADFGIAKVLSEALRDGPRTRAGVGMGTPAYMAPEQVNDAGGVDARADLFALGCVLYELVCGRKAFEGENMLSVLTAASRGDYPPPDAVAPGLPPGVSVAIQAALQPDRDRRPATAAALAALLDGGRTGPSGVPWRGTAGSQLGFAVGLGALFALAVVGGTAAIGLVGLAGVGLAAWTARDTPEILVISGDDGPEEAPPSGTPVFAIRVEGHRSLPATRSGVFRHQAAPGNHLLLVSVAIENLTSDEQSTFFPWSVGDDAGGEHDADLGCGLALEGALDPTMDFAPRQAASGELCFEVPKDARGLRVRFDGIDGADALFEHAL